MDWTIWSNIILFTELLFAGITLQCFSSGSILPSVFTAFSRLLCNRLFRLYSNKVEGEVGIGESYKWGHDLINESYYLTGNVKLKGREYTKNDINKRKREFSRWVALPTQPTGQPGRTGISLQVWYRRERMKECLGFGLNFTPSCPTSVSITVTTFSLQSTLHLMLYT